MAHSRIAPCPADVRAVPYRSVTCPAQARALLAHPDFGTRNGNKVPPQPPDGLTARVLTRSDGAWHTQMRRLADGALAGWLGGAQPGFDRHFAQVVAQLNLGRFEAIAPPLADSGPYFIAEWIGVPGPDRAALAQLCHLAFNTEDAGAFQELNGYLSVLTQLAQQHPERFPGLLQALAAPVASDLTAEERVRFVRLYFEAGTDTLTSLLAGLLWVLAQQPGEMAAIRGNPAAARRFARDVVRQVSPIRWVSRTATRAVCCDGQEFAKGDRVAISLTGPPAPRPGLIENDLDGCTSFGAGPHHCAGVAFASLLATRFLLRLADQCDRLIIESPPIPEPRNDVLRFTSAEFRLRMA